MPICTTNCSFRSSANSRESSSRPETWLSNSTAANGDFAVWAYDRHKLPICPLHYVAHPRRCQSRTGAHGRYFCRPAGVASADRPPRRRAESGTRQACPQRRRGATGHRRGREPAEWQPGHARRPDPGPALARRTFPRRRRRHQLSPLLRHQRPCRAADGIARIVRPHPCPRLRLLEQGTLDGLRIDHIDGLLDPKGVSASGCATGPRARSISSSRRSSRITSRCARIGRSRERPDTISPIWCWRCSSTRPRKTG